MLKRTISKAGENLLKFPPELVSFVFKTSDQLET